VRINHIDAGEVLAVRIANRSQPLT
jgi:hypothetical protein